MYFSSFMSFYLFAAKETANGMKYRREKFACKLVPFFFLRVCLSFFFFPCTCVSSPPPPHRAVPQAGGIVSVWTYWFIYRLVSSGPRARPPSITASPLTSACHGCKTGLATTHNIIPRDAASGLTRYFHLAAVYFFSRPFFFSFPCCNRS